MSNIFVNVSYTRLDRPVAKHKQNMKLYEFLLSVYEEVHIIVYSDQIGIEKTGNLYVHRLNKNPLLYIISLILLRRKLGRGMFNASDPTVAGIGLLLMSWIFGQAYTAELQGQVLNLDPTREGKIVSKLKRFATILTLTGACNIRCVSQALSDEVRNFKTIKTNVEVIPPRVDLELFQSREHYIRTRLMCIPARLVVHKGIEYAIHAVASFPQRKFKLRIVGDGPLKKELVTLVNNLGANELVEFTGAVDFRKMPQMLADCDYVLLPSIDEGFGRVLIEGMAVGLPCLASDVGGIANVIKDGYNGFKFESKSSQAIIDTLQKVIELGDDEYKDLVNNSRRYAQLFEENKGFKDLAKFYSSCG
jgi:glycosyltransferase involved in cell wall biosynthesis